MFIVDKQDTHGTGFLYNNAPNDEYFLPITRNYNNSLKPWYLEHGTPRGKSKLNQINEFFIMNLCS